MKPGASTSTATLNGPERSMMAFDWDFLNTVTGRILTRGCHVDTDDRKAHGYVERVETSDPDFQDSFVLTNSAICKDFSAMKAFRTSTESAPNTSPSEISSSS